MTETEFAANLLMAEALIAQARSFWLLKNYPMSIGAIKNATEYLKKTLDGSMCPDETKFYLAK